MATVSVLSTAMLVGVCLRFLIRQNLISWAEAFLMGAIVSSTDPVAVLSVLHSMNCPDKLMAIFEGESLLNDGVSVVIFQVIASFAKNETETGSEIFGKILLLLLGSPLYGLVHGMVATALCKVFRGQPTLQSVWLTINATLSFFIGEIIFGMSGPLVTVVYGLFVNFVSNRTLERNAERAHLNVVKNASVVCEMLIFMLAGAIISNMLLNGYEYIKTNTTVLDGFYLFLLMGVSRLFNTFCFMPLIKLYCPYSISFKEQILLWWGGLRGAIVIALCLVVYDDTQFAPKFRLDAPIIIAIAVAFNLVFQGSSFGSLFKFLNPYPPSIFMTRYNRYQCNKFERDFIDHIIDVYASLQDQEDLEYSASSLHQVSMRSTIIPPPSLLKRKESIMHSMTMLPISNQTYTSNVSFNTNYLRPLDVGDADKFVHISMALEGGIGDIPMAYGLRLFLPLYSQYLSGIDDIMHDFVSATANALPNFSELGPNDRNNQGVIPASIRDSLKNWIDNVHITDSDHYHDGDHDSLGEKPTFLRIHRNKKKNQGSNVDLLRSLATSSFINFDQSANNLQVDEIHSQRLSEVMLMINHLIYSKYQSIHGDGVINNTSFNMLINAVEQTRFLAERSLEEIARGKLKVAQKLCESLVSCEWTVLRQSLNINKVKSKMCPFYFYGKFPNRVMRSIVFRNCMADLECILTYLDVHEHIIVLGGNDIIQMMNGPILEYYEQSIIEAQRVLWMVINIYQDILHSSLFVLMAKILTKQKLMFVKRLSAKGLLFGPTADAMEYTLQGVMMKLLNYRDFWREIKDLRAVGPEPEHLISDPSFHHSLD